MVYMELMAASLDRSCDQLRERDSVLHFPSEVLAYIAASVLAVGAACDRFDCNLMFKNFHSCLSCFTGHFCGMILC
jgi:hypothetical protein